MLSVISPPVKGRKEKLTGMIRLIVSGGDGLPQCVHVYRVLGIRIHSCTYIKTYVENAISFLDHARKRVRRHH